MSQTESEPQRRQVHSLVQTTVVPIYIAYMAFRDSMLLEAQAKALVTQANHLMHAREHVLEAGDVLLGAALQPLLPQPAGRAR
jgi:hypothetical protein